MKLNDLLTDKCKDSFQEYLWKNVYTPNYWEQFNITFSQLTDAMQYGVLVDFFESVGIIIEDCVVWDNIDSHINIHEYTIKNQEELLVIHDGFEDSRPSARKKAIELANKTFNKNN